MSITMRDLPGVLETCRQAKKIPFIVGIPGVGKSQGVHQFRASLSQGNPNFWYLEFRGSTAEPTDIVGIPFPQNGRTVFLKPGWYPTQGPGIFFLDEFPQSSPSMMNAFSQLMDRVANFSDWPTDIMVVLAGNRQADKAATNRIPSHIRNRIVFIEVRFDVAAWTQHALSVGTRPEVIGFGNFRAPGFAEVPPADGSPFMTGRSLAACSDILNANPPDNIRLELFKGLIGEGEGNELFAFLKVYQSMVSPDAILLDPLGSPIPEELSARYAISLALAGKATVGNFDRVITYADRLSPIFSTLVVTSAIRKDNLETEKNPKLNRPKLMNTKAFVEWAVKHQDVIL